MYLLLAFLIATSAVCYVSIPPDVRSQLADNCRDRRGRLRRKYVVRELLAVGNFISGVFFFTFVAFLLAMLVFLLVDAYVIPFDLVASALSVAEFDVSNWKETLTTGENSVASRFRQWHVSNGGSVASAQTTMQSLWLSFPFMFVGCLGAVVVVLRATSKAYKAALEDLVVRTSERDLDHIRKQYLAENKERLKSVSHYDSVR